MKKEYNIDGETMKWIKSMDNGVRGWVKDTPDHIREIIESGDAFFSSTVAETILFSNARLKTTGFSRLAFSNFLFLICYSLRWCINRR
jgi:hypothetical protein